MSRSPSESSFCWVPGCGMHVPPPLHAALKAATAIEDGPLSVVLAEFDQSTWKRHRLSELVPKFMNMSGVPAGGSPSPPGWSEAVAPSKSDGRRPPYRLESWKHC